MKSNRIIKVVTSLCFVLIATAWVAIRDSPLKQMINLRGNDHLGRGYIGQEYQDISAGMDNEYVNSGEVRYGTHERRAAWQKG